MQLPISASLLLKYAYGSRLAGKTRWGSTAGDLARTKLELQALQSDPVTQFFEKYRNAFFERNRHGVNKYLHTLQRGGDISDPSKFFNTEDYLDYVRTYDAVNRHYWNTFMQQNPGYKFPYLTTDVRK